MFFLSFISYSTAAIVIACLLAIIQWFSLFAVMMPQLAETTLLLLHLLWALVMGCFTSILQLEHLAFTAGREGSVLSHRLQLPSGVPPLGELGGPSKEACAICLEF